MRPKKEKNKPGKIYTIPCAGNRRYPPYLRNEEKINPIKKFP